jgi:hypothetical protein
MRKRWLLTLTVVLGFAVLSCWVHHSRILVGWLRGEAFYRAHPTSYWQRELLACTEGFPVQTVESEIEGITFTHIRRCWFRRPFYVDFAPQSWRQHLVVVPPLLNGDPAAEEVLEELRNDPSIDVRAMAEDALGNLHNQKGLP